MTDHTIQADAAWHQDFFEGLMAEFWIEAVSDEQTSAEAAFLRETLDMTADGRYLDLACGAGRHLIALARQGFQVDGVDDSKLLTERARALCGPGLPASIERRDLRTFRPRRRYDGAWALGNSFGYFDHAENARFLETTAGALKPGGRFVIETAAIAECAFPGFSDREQAYDAGRYRLTSSRRHDAAAGYMHTRYQVAVDGKTETALARQAIYTVREFIRMAAQAGLTPLTLLADFDKSRFDVGADRLLAVFEKQS